MKKTILSSFIIMMLFASMFVTSCKYSSNYSAVASIEISDKDKYEYDFGSFKGTKSLILFAKDDDAKLKYDAELEQGTVNVYCDYNGNKELLFRLSDNEKVSDEIEIDKGKVYIIIESEAVSKEGNLKFKID